MSFLTRLRFALAGASYKAAQLPFVSPWIKTSWLLPSFDRLTRDGYAANGAVMACISRLAFKFPEAPLQVLSLEEEPLIRHPLQRLLRRPNPQMSEAELATFVVVYLAIGGNCYLRKVRNGDGTVIQIWPYHAGHITPIPGEYDWVARYEYDAGGGVKHSIRKEDIIHLKWPLPDLEQPWLAMPPLRPVARETDTDSELTRYTYALLMNDAIPRTAIQLPPGVTMSPTQAEQFRASWYQRFGGDGRGGVALLEGGATIARISLNMEELAADALRRVPEARIAAAFGVPAMVAGLNVGLERSTYSNMAEAYERFTKDTLVPLWRIVSDEIEQDLGEEFGGDVIVRHDLSRVAALQENEDSLHTRARTDWEKGVATRNEARRMIGLEEVEPERGDVFIDELTGVVEGAAVPADGSAPVNIEATEGLNGAQINAALAILAGVSAGTTTPAAANELLVSMGISPERARLMVESSQGVTVEEVPPRQLPPPEKGLKARAPESIEKQIERVAAEVLREHYQRAAAAVTNA